MSNSNHAEIRIINCKKNKSCNLNKIQFQILGDTDEDTPKAFNLYRNKKLLSHGMMDVALFSANANQLRYVLENSDGGGLSVICIVLLLMSIFLQVINNYINC